MVILSSIFMGLSFFDKVDASIRYNFDVTKPYGGLPDSEKMLKLPDGGLLYGKMVTSDKETGKILETFDSHTDSNSLSISEFKKEPSKVAPLRMSPPSEVRTLGASAFYQSSHFSSSGLRFGGYYFQAASGTGEHIYYGGLMVIVAWLVVLMKLNKLICILIRRMLWVLL